MTLESWDIERFPVTSLNKKAISDAGFPESDSEWKTWEEAQRALNDHAPGGGYDGGRSEYDPSVWMMGRHAPSHEKYRNDDDSDGSHVTNHEDHDEEYDDDDYDQDSGVVPETYHIVTRPRNSIPGVNAFDEHEHHTFGFGGHFDHDPERAWSEWEIQPENWDYHENNPDAQHEIVHVHPAEDHDTWRNQLNSEDEDFSRIAPHGLERESPDVPGHRAYRHEDPHGGTHRLWHSPYSENGPGWHTSYYNSGVDQQMPWTEHPDNSSDSLGEALKRVDRNKIHAQIAHSGVGFETVENSHGRHYVSKRPDGSIHQMLRNFDDSNGNDNWNVVHYPVDNSQHGEHYPSYMAPQYTHTEHGSDLAGALEQAKSNLTRG